MPNPEITALLREAARDEPLPRSAADRIFSLAYEELRIMAEREMRRERVGHTLQPTALLNEAYLRLIDPASMRWENRAHFFGVAAQAMRQVLIDYARRRGAIKRGRGWRRVTVTASDLPAQNQEIDTVDLDRALSKLAGLHPRMSRVVELRVFGGLTGEEIALALGVSRKTVVDDWRVASMWLRSEFAGDGPPAGAGP